MASYVDFDGISSYIDCGDDASLEDLHAATFTVEAWVRSNLEDGVLGGIAGKYDLATEAGWSLAINGVVGGSYVTGMVGYDVLSAYSECDEIVPNNTWMHLTMIYNTADRKVYLAVDGEWCTYSSQDASDGDLISDAGLNMLLGSIAQEGDPTYFLMGDISWVRISSGTRYTIGVGFTPPSRCTAPAVNGTTTELWALDEGVGVTTAAEVNSPENDGVMTDCLWHDCAGCIIIPVVVAHVAVVPVVETVVVQET